MEVRIVFLFKWWKEGSSSEGLVKMDWLLFRKSAISLI